MGPNSTYQEIKKRQKSMNMQLNQFEIMKPVYHGRSLSCGASNVSSAVKLKPLDVNQTYSISAKKGKIMNHYSTATTGNHTIHNTHTSNTQASSVKQLLSHRNSVD